MISTYPETRSGWLRADLVGRVQASTGKPVEHIVADEEGRLMESASIAAGRTPTHDEHHGPPAPNFSSRVDAQILGMLLFIISEVMLFGAFFTAYFFIRVVADDQWFPIDGKEIPKAGRRRQHRDPGLVELHDALGARGGPERQPRALRVGLLTTLPARADLPLGPDQRVLPHRLRAHDNAQGTIFYGLTGLHGAHVFVGLTLLTFATIRAFRGHFTPKEHRGVEVPGIYWHFVDVMWIVVYSTVYIL